MESPVRELTEEDVESINDKIEWEGLDYYLTEYAEEDFKDTDLEAPLAGYLLQYRALVGAMRALEIDV